MRISIDSREEIFDCIKKLKNDKASEEDGTCI